MLRSERTYKKQNYSDLLKPKCKVLNTAVSSIEFRHRGENKIRTNLSDTKEKRPFPGEKHSKEYIRRILLNSPRIQPVIVVDTEANEK